MEDYRFLRFLDKFKNMYTGSGVDYDKMRIILALKLTLDRRRNFVLTQNQDNSQNMGKSSYIMSFAMYAFMGLFTGLIAFLNINEMMKFTMVFSMIMFIILTAFISDFSSVLLDVKDKIIIGTKGISSRTINAAKVTHICYYIFLITVAVSWLSIPAMFIKYGVLTGLIFMLELIISDVLLIVLTALIYYLILKFFDGEKVKDIINIVQIVLAVSMTVGYQLMGQMFNLESVKMAYSSSLWNILLPPMWFAAPLYGVNTGEFNSIIIILTVMAFALPLTAMIIYLKNSADFEDSLYKLTISKNSEKQKRKGLLYNLGRMFCKSPTEKACYDLSNAVMKRERKFKLRTYPSLAFLVFFPLLFIFIYFGRGSQSIFNMSIIGSLNIYWFAFMAQTIIINLQYSENYKASWIYGALYIKNKTDIYKGAYKALFFNMILPLYIIESIIFLVVFGRRAITVLISAFAFMTIVIVFIHNFYKLKLPFSREFDVVEKQGSIAVLILVGIINAAACGINYLVMENLLLSVLYIAVLIGVSLIMWKKCFKQFD